MSIERRWQSFTYKVFLECPFSILPDKNKNSANDMKLWKEHDGNNYCIRGEIWPSKQHQCFAVLKTHLTEVTECWSQDGSIWKENSNVLIVKNPGLNFLPVHENLNTKILTILYWITLRQLWTNSITTIVGGLLEAGNYKIEIRLSSL